MKYSNYNLIIPNDKVKDSYFLFNTLNGNCIEIDADIVDKIKINNSTEIDKETLKLFVNSGILVDDTVDERKLISYYHGRAKYTSNSISSTVLLTWACNLRCVYCFENFENEKANMTIEQADRYIRFITMSAKSKNSRSIYINLFGGEPLVNIDVGFYILEKVNKFCEENKLYFSCSIITNGTLLNEDILDKLIYYNCKMIQITLDGVKEIHDTRRMYKDGRGSFDKIIESLNLLKNKEKSPHTVIRINIDKTNIGDTYKLLETIGKNEFDFTKFTVDFGIVRSSTNACSGYSSNCLIENEIGDVLYDLWGFAEKQKFVYNIRPMRKWMYCGLYGDNQFTIAPNCEVYKCWEHVGQKEHLMGNLDDNGNFTNPTYAFYDWMSNDPIKNEECYKCVYLPACGGGCGVISYNETGTYHSTGCFKIKGTVEKQVLKYVESVLKSKNKSTCDSCYKSDRTHKNEIHKLEEVLL